MTGELPLERKFYYPGDENLFTQLRGKFFQIKCWKETFKRNFRSKEISTKVESEISSCSTEIKCNSSVIGISGELKLAGNVCEVEVEKFEFFTGKKTAFREISGKDKFFCLTILKDKKMTGKFNPSFYKEFFFAP